ncbi:alpha/beta fold hydrolase [Frigidibacter mobilis]|uniref:alpha/beta fold hydrolase n=1 Tax=Frigidibacter mobilis TaxID=1335048 RepID=UPI000AEBE985|nr:alpha/beta fold hydrolase [Frigidibacter mobilis]
MAQNTLASEVPPSLQDAFAELGTAKRRLTRRGTAYVQLGQGEPLVLVHGVGMRLEAWAPQIVHFARSHTVIALDMPGHGSSAALPIGSNLRDFVGWLGDVLDDLGLEAVNVAGHSMGALIAGGAAVTLPDRILRVACLNAAYRRSMAAKRAVLERAAAIWTEGIDPDGPIGRWFDGSEGSREVSTIVHGWLAGASAQSYAVTYTAFATGDEIYAGAWPGITVPALFLTGAGDPNSTPEMSRQMAALAPRGQLSIIEGHRHMVNLTAPGQVNAAMETWLNTGCVAAGTR